MVKNKLKRKAVCFILEHTQVSGCYIRMRKAGQTCAVSFLTDCCWGQILLHQHILQAQWETLWTLRGGWITLEHFSFLIMMNGSLLITSVNRESSVLRCYIWIHFFCHEVIWLHTNKSCALVFAGEAAGTLGSKYNTDLAFDSLCLCSFFIVKCFCLIMSCLIFISAIKWISHIVRFFPTVYLSYTVVVYEYLRNVLYSWWKGFSRRINGLALKMRENNWQDIWKFDKLTKL